MTVLLLFTLLSGGLWAEVPCTHRVNVNVDLSQFPIEMTADWTFDSLLENAVFFDFQPGVCSIDAVRVNGIDTAWNQSGSQFTVEVGTPTSTTVISIDWHATPGNQSDGIRKQDSEYTHSITAISTPFGPSLWMPIPSDTAFCVTGTFSFAMPSEMDGVATGIRVSDSPITGGHSVEFEITNPVSPQELFFSMASGREIKTDTVTTLTGDRAFGIYPYPGLQTECETDLAPVHTLLPMLEQWFGAFPDTPGNVFSACVMDFDQVAAVPGILALGQGFITGEGNIDKRLANGLAGQWWGCRFPVYDTAHLWVTEGLRTYSEVLVTSAETTGTEESQVDLAADILQNYDLGGTTLEGPLVISEGNPYDHPYVLTAKGAYTLHMLRTIVGDSCFFNGLKSLSALDSPASASNRLQFALEKETRFPLGSFLRQWTNRSPRPVLNYRFDSSGNRLVLDISQPDADDGGAPFRIPLQVTRGEDTTTVWLTEKQQRFLLPQGIESPELDPHFHTLKLALGSGPILDAPDLEVSLSTDSTIYPFRLVPNFSELPESTRSWRIDGIPVTEASDGSLHVDESGAHTVQLTVFPTGQTPVSQVLSIQIPQPDGDINGDGLIDAADLAMVLKTTTADPIPNGTRDESDISFLNHLLLSKTHEGSSITPNLHESSTEWQLSLQSEPDTVAASHVFYVNIKIHGPSAVQMLVANLLYDPEKLEPVSISAATDVRLLFSSKTPGKWTLVLGSTDGGINCSGDGGEILSTVRFRALAAGNSATIQASEESCLFTHGGDNCLLPSIASTELSLDEGTITIPMILNTDKWETSLGLIETGNNSDTIVLTALDNNGNTVASNSLSLAPGQRLVRNVTDLFGDMSSIASVRITGNGAIQAWAEYRDKENEATAACPASIETGNQLLVPHVDEGNYWNTLTGIINCGNSDSPLKFTAAGNEVTVNEHTPPEGGYHDRFIHLMDAALLQGGWGIFDGGTAPLAGAEMFYRVDSLHQAAALRLSDKTARTFYFPHIDINGFWWTGISLINPGNEAATIKLEAFDIDGHAIPDTDTATGTASFSLPGQTRRVDLVENFFDKPLDSKAAWIRVESDQPLTGLEIFGSRGGFQEDLSAGLEAVSEPSVSMTFPWAADGENGQWCGLALLNPDETNPADDITVTLLTADGTTVGLAALHLQPLQKHVVLVRDLFGGAVPAGGAYLKVQSDVPLVGFELSGDDGHQWLMGLDGM